ncbi:tumor necrosis factor receptor superfamily member 19-like [Actinia tenebrosa]|uniref:Tumor necrosis factor receptor superfamily member 19-like n=1 Tax=Actinia tenebrosa TaxID=6105 RepID=A0A6P8HIQ4_ACTTE|nr:tumor necrosis factor receptor superfamily member 19-like [Actinia tenebrosa]
MKQQVVQIVYTFCILLSAKKLVDCKQHTCSKNQYVIIDDQGRKSCLTCNNCPSGRGLYPPCGSELYHTARIDCFPCTENTYSDEYGPSSCKSCGICSSHEIVNNNCTASQNTNCSKACARGYYYDTTTHGCQQCSECCGNGEDIRIEECKKHDMPRSKQCSVHQSQHCKKGTTTSSPGGLQPHDHDSGQQTTWIIGLVFGIIAIIVITVIIIILTRTGRIHVPRRKRNDVEAENVSFNSNLFDNLSASLHDDPDTITPIECILETSIGEAPNVGPLKTSLKILLDPSRSFGGDIKSLADAFGYNGNKIDFLMKESHGSPTEELLRAKGHKSIKYLLEKLVYIEREDAARKLREYIKSQNCECERCK